MRQDVQRELSGRPARPNRGANPANNPPAAGQDPAATTSTGPDQAAVNRQQEMQELRRQAQELFRRADELEARLPE